MGNSGFDSRYPNYPKKPEIKKALPEILPWACNLSPISPKSHAPHGPPRLKVIIPTQVLSSSPSKHKAKNLLSLSSSLSASRPASHLRSTHLISPPSTSHLRPRPASPRSPPAICATAPRPASPPASRGRYASTNRAAPYARSEFGRFKSIA